MSEPTPEPKPEPAPKLYANTRCRIVNRSDMRFDYSLNRPVNIARAWLPDNILIQPNWFHFADRVRYDQEFRYFLMDHKEHVKARMLYSKDETDEERKFEKAKVYLASMTAFSEHFKKNLYLRLVPPNTLGGEKEHRVLVEEVIEMIPIAMKQQKTPIEKDDPRMIELLGQYPETETSHTVIPIDELEVILHLFDINKSLITIVPDPATERMLAMHVERGEPFRIPGPAMKWIINTHQAVNFIFESLVVGIDWSRDPCVQHVKCNEKAKTFIIRWMQNMGGLSDKIYFDPEVLYRILHKNDVNCLLNRKTEKGKLDVFVASPQKETFINRYHNIAKQFNLTKYPLFARGSRRDYMPDWEIKFLGHLGWLQQFFGEHEHTPEKYILVECLYFHSPAKHLQAARKFVNTIVPPKNAPVHQEPSPSQQEPSTSKQESSTSQEGSTSDDADSVEELGAKMKDVKVQPKKSGKHKKKKKGKKGKKGKK